ncbi:helicase-exonuclease AddAB subunit AddB [Paenibacillus sp. IITD108]|uniref:helicase-exonuclease AddAB subunit AddB n=1 Tax=Paenibacillus sp. IITD108 TaxID=3116649 RepID=UPI002F3FC135
MSLQFVIGRSGSGKTTYCLQQITKRLREEPLGSPLIALVPEQASFQTEYGLLQQNSLQGSLRAQALSFRRLAFRVMQETGGTAITPISDTGKHMLLHKVIRQQANELQLFSGGLSQPGFMERLVELLTEWKRYGIDAAEVERQLGNITGSSSLLLERKLHDLALLYHYAEQQMSGHYLDAEDYLHRLRDQFDQAPSMDQAHIWIDGFHGFTPAEYEALRTIIRSAASVTVALTLDRPYSSMERPHELDLFHPTAETFIALSKLAEEQHVELLPTIQLCAEGSPARVADNEMLAVLERGFGRAYVPEQPVKEAAGSGTAEAAAGLSLHAAANRRAEVEAIARDLLRRAREDQIRWRDCAVMLRNSEDYLDYIELIFTDYNIPFFIDQKEKAFHHPLVEFISSALETVSYGWQHDAVFRCIKTELLFPLDSSLPREWYDLLENYVLARGISSWKWQDAHYWTPQARIDLEQDTGQEPVITEEARLQFEAVMAARQSIVEKLQRFEQRLTKAANVRQMCEAIYLLLEEAGAAERLEAWSEKQMEAGEVRKARNHRQLWSSIMNMLDQLVSIAGAEQVELELLIGMVQAGLDSLKLASVPPALDQVLIGSMDRTRSGQIKVCYIAGANDGVMPMRYQEDGLLSEPEREQLAQSGLQMAPSINRRLLDERFIIYNALTSASDHLWISWAQADAEGKGLLPSEIIRQIKKLFPALVIQEPAAEPVSSMCEQEQRQYVEHPQRSLTYLIAMLQQWQHGQQIPDFWWGVYNWFAARPIWKERLALLTRSLFYRNDEQPLSVVTAKKLYGSDLKGSVSRMERFVSCPFQHFAIHGLKLRERKLYKLEAPDIGQLFHAALSRLSENQGASWGSATRDELDSASKAIVEELAPKLQSQILLSSGRFQYVTQKLKDIILQAALILGEHARRAKFQPVGTEIDFGPGAVLPALSIPLSDGGEMELIGRIDRVDAAETEDGLLLRVVDYKSSSTSLQLQDVAYGLSLQMLTYMDVLLTHAERWLGKPVLPAGVLYFHVHNPTLSMSSRPSQAEANAQLLKKFKTKGLISADVQAVRWMDNQLESGYSDLLPVAIKKDESFYSSSSVVTNEQWTMLRQAIRDQIAQVGCSIKKGVVAIEPYRIGNKTPCEYCDYKAVCQFDPLIAGNSYKKMNKLTEEELWEQWRREV